MNESHAQSHAPQDKWSGRLSNTKDGLEIARQLLVVTVILVLIFAPAAFKKTLAALGIETIGIAGLEMKVAQKVSEETGDTAQQLEEVSKSTRSRIKQLDERIRLINNQEQKRALEALKADLNETLEVTSTAEQKLNASLAVQTSILQNVEPQDVQASGTWGIVISADKELADAQHEIKKAQDAGYQNVKVYSRQDWLRTVVEFPNFAQAQAALPKLRSLRSSSYPVNMDKWCPSRSKKGDGVWQCPGQ